MAESSHASHLAAERLFDRTADNYLQRADVAVYNTSSLMFARRKEVVLSLLDQSGTSGVVLDFGMGPGVFARDVTDRGFEFVGIDISAEMVKRAEALSLPKVTYIQGDLDALEPFVSSVDVVLAIGLIDYLEEVDDGIDRLARCLKPGGVLIVSFRNQRSLNNALRVTAKAVWRKLFAQKGWRPDTAFASDVYERTFSFAAHLRPMLARHGLTESEARYLNFSPFIFFNIPLPVPLWRFLRAADQKVARPATRWGCSSGAVMARKAKQAGRGGPVAEAG